MQNKTFTASKDPTFEQWSNYWLRTYIRPVAKPGGYEHYRDNLSKHIVPKLGAYRLSELTVPVVQQFLNDEAEHGNLRDGGPLSAKSIKNMRVVLDTCCKRAVAEGVMSSNPVPLTVIKHCKSKRVTVMQDEDQIKLQNFLLSRKDSRSNAILLAMYIGPRLGEICALRWKHYDFEQGILHFEETVRRIAADEAAELPYGQRTSLVFSAVKTDSSDRELYLSEDLQELMHTQYELFREKFGRCPTQGDFIFFSNVGGVLDPDNLSSHFTRTLDQLGLPHVKFHALRHTFASRAVEKGMAVSTLSGILGHADVTTTTHYYLHPREAEMRRATMGLGRISEVGGVA